MNHRLFESELSMIKKTNTEQCISLVTKTISVLTEINEDLLQIVTIMTGDSPNLVKLITLLENGLQRWNQLFNITYDSLRIFSSSQHSEPIIWQSYVPIQWKRPILPLLQLESVSYSLQFKQAFLHKQQFHEKILTVIRIREQILQETDRAKRTILQAKRYLTLL